MPSVRRLGCTFVAALFAGGLTEYSGLGWPTGFLFVIALVVVGAVAYRRLTALPFDGYAPVFPSRDERRRMLARIKRVSPERAARIRLQESVRDAMEDALTARRRKTADAKLARATELLAELEREHRAPRAERRAMAARFKRDSTELATCRYLNEARASLEGIDGLKTERGRATRRQKAQDVVSEGLRDERADAERLRAFATEAGLGIGSPTPAVGSRAGPAATARTTPEAVRHPELSPSQRASWLRPGDVTHVHGFELRGGFVYVGAGLARADGAPGTEPAVINSELDVDRRRRAGAEPSGQLAYDRLDPRERRSFLEFIAGDRAKPDVAAGYVRLYLYGIERRLFGDADLDPDGVEPAEIAREVARIATLYGVFAPVGRIVYPLLDYLELAHGAETGERPAGAGADGQAPLALCLTLGRLARDREPVPSELALEWLNSCEGGRRRAPAERCPAEFRALFKLLYSERFGAGMRPPVAGPRVRRAYVPENPSLGRRRFESEVELVDVAADGSRLARLAELADRACDELSAFSRKRARAGSAPPTLAELALLPPELVEGRDDPGLIELRALLRGSVGDSPTVIDASDLIERFVGQGDAKKRDCAQLAHLLAGLGVGLEPDVRFDGPRLRRGGKAALFRLARDAPRTPSRAYASAALTLRLAASVTATEGRLADAERERLALEVDAFELTPAERARLLAHIAWLAADTPGLAGIKRRLAGLDETRRAMLGRLLVEVAWADGRLDPDEVRTLGRAYELLGLDASRIHSDLHQARVGGTRGPEDAPEGGDEARPAVALDARLLSKKRAETERVAALLRDLFREDEPAATVAGASGEVAGVAGLDPAHTALLRALGARPSWGRDEVEELAESLGLLTDGALDVLNEASFVACDAPLWEGDDPLDIDTGVAEELLS